jgi:hypothetical protein
MVFYFFSQQPNRTLENQHKNPLHVSAFGKQMSKSLPIGEFWTEHLSVKARELEPNSVTELDRDLNNLPLKLTETRGANRRVDGK